MSSKIIASTTSGTALNMSADTTGILEIQTGATPTTAVTIDSSQNVGIGTSSPACKADVAGAIRTTSIGAPASGVGLELSYGGTANTADILSYDRTGAAFKNIEMRCSNLIFNTGGGGERARIDSSGNVLVNSATLPTALNTNFKNIYVKGANNGVVAVSSNDGLASVTLYSGANSSDNPAIAFQNSLRFATATDVGIGGFAERMRIDSGGSLLVGTTATVVGEKVSIKSTGTWNTLLQIPNNGNGLIITNASGTASYQAFTFYNNGTTFSQTGYIQVSGTTTTYATSSDYRLKENIAPMQNALNVVSKLKPVTYKWKSNGSDGQGFIAHELAEIVPDCVSGNKDAVDEDGKPVYQGIDTSFLVATLTAAIQEQQVLITQLQADIAELKGVK